MARVPDQRWVEDIINAESRYDRDVVRAIERMWWWEEYVYKKEGKVIDGWKEFYKIVKKKLERAARELRKRGVDIEKIGWRRLRAMVVKLFLQWAGNFFDPSKVSDDILVYGESMGFVLYEESNEWEVFEGSDEPGEVDMELFQKLILGKRGQRKKEKITLYGMHGLDFVQSWEEKGIPEEVYFAEEKWIARRYWHTKGDDVLVKVKLPVDAVIPTADKEWKTVRLVRPREFSIVFV
jgi:hypothetical protein